MSLQGYALTAEVNTEIVSAYASGQLNVEAKATAPGWIKVGSFFLPIDVKGRLDVLGQVSGAGLVATCQLYDPTPGVDNFVSGSQVSFSGQSDGRILSSVIALLGNRQYLILCQCIGTPGIRAFATITTIGLTGP